MDDAHYGHEEDSGCGSAADEVAAPAIRSGFGGYGRRLPLSEQNSNPIGSDPGAPARSSGGLVYFFENADRTLIKIGVTQNIKQRVGALQNTHGGRLIGYMGGDHGRERQIHERLERFRVKGEWFAACPDVLKFIQKQNLLVQMDLDPASRLTASCFVIATVIRNWVMAGRTRISISEMQGSTGFSRATVVKAVHVLERNGFLIIRRSRSCVSVYSLTEKAVSDNRFKC